MHEKTLSRKTAFQGRLFNVEVLDVELECGTRSFREIVRHPGAVAVLCRLPDGRFGMVRQFRKPVEKEVLEIVAGTLDPGEPPDDCARREVREETGHAVLALTKLGVIHPAPGYTDEALHMYFALLDANPGRLDPDEDERIEVEYLSEEEIETQIARGDIHDAKTLSAWQLMRSKDMAVAASGPDGRAV